MDNVLEYNTGYAVGEVEMITPATVIGKHKVLNFLIDCEQLDGSKPRRPRKLMLAAWDEIADKAESFKEGKRIQVLFTLSSKPNKKLPDTWYHVVTAREILEL